MAAAVFAATGVSHANAHPVHGSGIAFASYDGKDALATVMLRNDGDDDVLISASSDAYETVQLGWGSPMGTHPKVERLDRLPINKGQQIGKKAELSYEPGLLLSLQGLRVPIENRQVILIWLKFEKGGDEPLEISVIGNALP